MSIQPISLVADSATTGFYILSINHQRALFGIEHSDVLGFGLCICLIWVRFE